MTCDPTAPVAPVTKTRSGMGDRLVRADLRLEADRQPVPSVDRDDRHRQLHQLTFIEMLERGGVLGVRDTVADPRYDFGPRERRALARRVKRCLVPDRNGIDALLRL